MEPFARFSIAFLCSFAAFVPAYYCGSLFLLLFDSDYHDGFAAGGGVVLALVVAILVFKAVVKKLTARL